jgi:cytochrome c peroxidase
MTYRTAISALITLILLPGLTFAHGDPPDPLKGVKVPATPGLVSGSNRIVVDKKAAIQLGKALFWDASVGSDGVACATCHFHAGADRRTRNQLDTGVLHTGADTATSFEPTLTGGAGGPDYQLKQGDFPLVKFADPADKYSAVEFETDDVVSSSGAFLGRFQGTDESGTSQDRCDPLQDDIFHLGSNNTRRVAKRNAPSVYNAAYNFRNFWDGRANNLFNGVSPFGARDPDARVWITKNGKARPERILLKNASLASQAVGPPLDMNEMSCAARTFHALGRKLYHRRPLENQTVHTEDSVLAALRDSSGQGLNTTYAKLIKKSFARRFWAGQGDFGAPGDGTAPYSQLEANFAFFFGLAIQLYEETLIADQTLFDTKRDKAKYPIAFNEQQKRGLQVYQNAHCFNCHLGPTLSAAANPKVFSVKSLDYFGLINRAGQNEDVSGIGVALYLLDTGYSITSVAPWEYDVGLGGKDPFGNPLSFAQQYLDSLADPSKKMVDPIKVVACELQTPFAYDFFSTELIPDPNGKGHCRGYKELSKVPSPAALQSELSKLDQGRVPTGLTAAFKIPQLRNVELTGPYMHNGSMKSLEEVIEFYNRGGNLDNPHHVGTLVFPQGFTGQDKVDLLAFLKTLTDERVRWEKAPFDHPSLEVPNGHAESHSPSGAGQLADEFLHVPAVGKAGRTPEQGPLLPFDQYLSP